MKKVLTKIWVPILLVMVAAMQSFGIDAGRNASLARLADSLALNQLPDSTSAVKLDTIVVPESLKLEDPIRYKYYIALKDSVVRLQLRDSLVNAGDSLELARLDSLYLKDSTDIAQAKFNAWYSSLSRIERKRYDAQQALPALLAAANRKVEIKDSIKAHRDSVREATPRVLDTYVIPDSMHYKRIITWKHERDFNSIHSLRDMASDTSYNHNFHDYPFFREDLDATWLGVSGSPAQLYDYFSRKEEANVVFYTPYTIWGYSPETLPQYNTKTPYTELAYYGTLFANQEKEESNIRVFTTQNITPELNLTLEYRRFGGNGMLKREDTDNRTFVASTNYLGKKYLMHAGFIYNKIERSENGGIIDEMWIRDTTVDSREIDVYLRDANNLIKRMTFVLP